MGITLLTKNDRNKPKNISKKNEVQCRDDVPAKKEGGDMRLLGFVTSTTTSISISFSFVLIIQIVTCVHEK